MVVGVVTLELRPAGGYRGITGAERANSALRYLHQKNTAYKT